MNPDEQYIHVYSQKKGVLITHPEVQTDEETNGYHVQANRIFEFLQDLLPSRTYYGVMALFSEPKFPVGSKVYVINTGAHYSSYESFMKQHIPDWKEQGYIWPHSDPEMYLRRRPEGTEFKVLAFGINDAQDDRIYIILRDNGNLYMVGERGLEEVNPHV